MTESRESIPNLSVLWLLPATSTVSLLEGDYNSNGTVEQADLDLVLLHWGDDAVIAPPTWTNDLPTGSIDQEELDKVLLGWGKTVAAFGAARVPEPGGYGLIAVCFGALALSASRRPRHATGRDNSDAQ